MHRYNNQDHSMLTAMLAVENIVDDAGHDLWAVNVDEEYHEERSTTMPRLGRPRPRRSPHDVGRRTRRRVSRVEAPQRAVLDEVVAVGRAAAP